MIGRGSSFGAVTVVNAMACGIGCTIGTELCTEAVFDLSGCARTVDIIQDPSEDSAMARICVASVFDRFGLEEPEGWTLRINSNIPISRGLKSSSSACNAIISAVLDALCEKLETMDMIRLGVACAKKAKVTVTGSFDDACGCHLGGLVMTDNRSDTLIFDRDFDTKDVVIFVPEVKIRKTALPLDKIAAVRDKVAKIVETAKTDPMAALTENGRVYAKAIGVDNSMADKAMDNGALAAGMTGSGPAIVALTEKGDGMRLALDVGATDFILTRTRGKML